MKKRLYFVLFVLLSLALILSACSDKNDGDVDTATEYTVSFVSRGEVFDSYKAEEGSTISFPNESPKNYEDGSYVYEFAGWSLTENGNIVEAGGKLTGNVTYYAVFNATNKEDLIPKYTVIFVDGLTGETIDTVSVKKGESAKAPKAPVHEGYTFTGWDKDFDNISSRTEVVAEYERNEYTFTIVNLGATVSEKVLYGDAISPGAASKVYGLTFDGWFADENYTVSFDTVAKGGMPAKNVTAYAKYSVDLTGARIEFPEYSVYGGEPVSVYLPRYYDESYEGDDYENVPEIVDYTYLWDDGSTEEVFDFRGAGTQSVSVTVTATYAYDGGTVVTDIKLSDECEVAKATLDVGVSFAQNVITYGVTPAPVFDIKGFVGDDASTQTALIKPVYASLGVVADAAKLSVGNYIVSVDGTALADYEVTGHLAYLTVNRAPLDVEVVFDKDSYIYGDEVIVSLAYDGFVYDDGVTDLESPGTVKHVRGVMSNGAYSAGEHGFVGEGCVSDSYDFNYISASKLIAKAPLTVKASTDKAVYVYGEIPVVTHTFTGFVNGENPDVISGDAVYVYTGETSYGLRAAGEHSVTTEGFVTANYEIDYVKADFTVLKAELTGKVVIADSDNFVYGDMLRLSLELTGFVGGESLATLGVSPVYTVVAGENEYSPVDKLHVGKYSVNASLAEPANYTVVSIESAPLTIGKKTLTVKLSTDKEYVYGETVTPTVAFTGFVYGEDATTAGCVSEIKYYSKDLSLYTEDIFIVGDGYSAYAEGGSTADYVWKSSAWTNFDVVKKTASVTVNTNKTEYVYGENVTATLEYSGLVYGETPAEAFGILDIVYVKDGVTLDNVNNPGIGTYTLSASGYREPDNYVLETYGNEFTIVEREFLIRVNAVAASESVWSKSEGFDTLTLDYGTFYVDGTLKLNTTAKGLYTAVGESLSGSEFVWNGNMMNIRLGSVAGSNVTANFLITYDISVNLTDKSFEGVNISIKNNNLVYTGFAQSLGSVSADNATSAVNVTYSLAESGEYASSAPTAVNAGNYTVYYRVTAVGYEGTVEGSYTAVVARAVNRIEKISDGNYVYNGESQTVDIAKLVRADFGVPEVTDGSNVFTAVPAGGYLVFTVSVAETSNYSSAEYELSVPIAKAEITLNANDVSAKYDGSAFGADVVLTVEGAYEGDAVFSYEYSYGGNVQTSPFTFVNAGAYSVTVRVTSANYAEVTATYTVTIAKGDYEVVVSEETFTYTGVAQGNDVTVTGSDPYTVNYYYNGVLYTGEGAPAYVDAGTYAIRCIVKAGTANYNDCEVSYNIIIAVAQNAVSRIDGKDFSDYVYNGEWQTVDYASVLKADFGTLIVTNGNASFLNVPSGGVHRFTVGVVGNANYTACSYEVSVNVAKANYTPDEIPADAVKSDDIVMRLGRTLAFVELNAGFSWVDPSAALATGTFYAYYCADPVNYNPREVAVNVVARKESVMLSVSENIEADYGVTRLDGLVSVTATGEGRTLTDDEAALVYTISTNADYTVGGTYTVSYVLNENDYYEVRFDGRAGSEFVTSFKIRSVKVGSVSYTIEDALFAASGGTVIVTADTAFATASVKEAVGGLYANTAYYTVKSGVTLLVPYDINYSTDTNTTETSASAIAAVKVDNAFSKLILTAGNTLTVNGKLIVNAKRNATTSTTSTVNGANYGEMEIAGGATVILASGSVYESIGFTYGAGEIVAKSGSNVYEPLNMLNWKGGTIASNIKDDVFPLNQFTASSIVAKMRVEYGANYYLKATINISYFGVQRTDVKFVSTGTDALLQLSESSSYIYKYIDESNGEFNLELHGAIRFYNLSVTIRLTVITQTVSTSGKDIPLPGNIKVTIASGTTTVPNGISVKLLPGAEIEVKEGATLSIQSGGKLYGYGEGCATFDSGLTAWRDGALGRGYPYNYNGAYRVKPVMDFNATTPAVVLVAGTLNAESGSTLAAGIEGVNGGKLTVGASVGVSGTIKEDNSPAGGEAYFHSTITGKLISENSSANLSAGRTYNYIDGVWA